MGAANSIAKNQVRAGSQHRLCLSKVVRVACAALLVAAIGAFSGAPSRAQSASATVTVGGDPYGIAVNPVTNKIYAVNVLGPTLTVVDGATNATSSLNDANGNGTYAVAVNPLSNMVYATNHGSGNISVFTGALGATPAQYVTTIPDGSNTGPWAIAVNPKTNMIYVCNNTTGTLAVINGANNTVVATVTVGGTPESVAVNPVTNMIYVANDASNNVSVISGATNTVTATVSVGAAPESLAVNPVTNKIYVAAITGGNITVIDGSNSTVSATLQDQSGSGPVAVAVNPETNQIYVANLDGNTTVINGVNNAVVDVATSGGSAVAVDTVTNIAYVANVTAGKVTLIYGSSFNGITYPTSVITAGSNTQQIAVNPVTHKAYAENYNTSGTVTVIDGATNINNTISTNAQPAVIAVNPVTNLIYVANGTSSASVTVIDGSSYSVVTTVQVGANPTAIVVDPVNNLVYTANHDAGTVSVIDANYQVSTIAFFQPITPDSLTFNPVINEVYGASNAASMEFQFSSFDSSAEASPYGYAFGGVNPVAMATNPALGLSYTLLTSGMYAPYLTVESPVGNGYYLDLCSIPDALDVNPNTNTVWVACTSGDLDVIEGATSFYGGTTTTLHPSSSASLAAVAVNPTTDTAYFADSGGNTVDVVSGGSSPSVTAQIPVNNNPVAVAVNVASNKVYVVSQSDSNSITIIDGATNTILGTVPLTAPGSFTEEIATDPITGNIFAADNGGFDVTYIAENQVQANGLTTSITPFANNTTYTGAPTFTFTPSNGLTTVPVAGVYYQLDSQQGNWAAANPPLPGSPSGNFTANLSGVVPGFHIIYAYATDGEDATSTVTWPQSSPLVGTIASYPFLAAPPIAGLNYYALAAGNVAVGTSSSNQNALFMNSGGAALNYSYQFTGPNASDFVVDANSSCPNPGTLQADSSCNVNFTFNPSIVGSESATLTFTDNSLAINNSTQSVGATGTGIASSVFSNLMPSQSILAGTASITLGGTISASSSYPPSGETVTITIDSLTQNATIGNNGAFSTTFNTSTIRASGTPYTITYSYPGDSNFAAGSDSSTTLTVNSANTFVTGTVTLLGTGTGTVSDGANLVCQESNGITTGNCSGSYQTGSHVTLTATPTPPSTFGGWTGACASSGTSTTCTVTANSAFTATANFVPPAAMVNLTFPAGVNSTQMATFDCPSNSNPTPANPCTDPNAHALQFTIPNVNTGFTVTLQATEVPPSQEDGICETGNTVLNDFDCRFVTFFNGGSVSTGTLVPLCYPYANGNCVHYLVYDMTGGPGTEPNPNHYSGGVYWGITWNNDTFTPPANNYSGSLPRLYDDPDSPPTPGAAFGTNCNNPMYIGTTPQTYSCQFEFDITTFYDPTKPVDSGIGGNTKQFNDVVVAFPPTSEIPPTQAPVITSPTSTTFTAGTPGSFVITSTGYPTPKLAVTGLPAGVTLNTVTGVLGGAATTPGTYNVTVTAANSVATTNQSFTLKVVSASSEFSSLTPSQSISYGTSSINLAGVISAAGNYPPSGETVTITINSVAKNATIGSNGAFSTTFSTATIPASATPYTITYGYAGDSNFSSATDSSTTLTVNAASQIITFPAPPSSAAYNTTFAVSASSSSTLPVKITPSGACSISNGMVTMTSGTGTCTLTASQAGNMDYKPATNVVRMVTATLASQTITFSGAPTSAAYGTQFPVMASATSNLPVTITPSSACSVTGTTVTITASSGTCMLTASQSGNMNYSAAASKTQSTTATKANSTATITSNTPNPSTVNQAVTVAFKVSGTGTPTGTVKVTASTGATCSGTLTAGAGSCSITFTAPGSPTLSASYSGDGNFNSSMSTNVSQTVNGSTGSTLKISPSALNFGTAYVGFPVLRTATLTNTGTSMITFTSFTVAPISGDDSTGFYNVELCPKTLNAGKSCVVIIGFLADSNVSKTHAANFVITDNATGSPQTIPMTVSSVINPIASLSPNSVNFGNQRTNTPSTAKSVTLTNTGSTPLILSSLGVSGNFALAAGTSCTKTTTLQPGGNCALKITFTPTSRGSKSGAVTIEDNALQNTSTVSLYGNGD